MSERHDQAIIGVKHDANEMRERVDKMETTSQEIISRQHGFAELRRQVAKNAKMMTGLDTRALDETRQAQIPRGRIQGSSGGG